MTNTIDYETLRAAAFDAREIETEAKLATAKAVLAAAKAAYVAKPGRLTLALMRRARRCVDRAALLHLRAETARLLVKD